MPAYDYRCQSCASVFEINQRISEPVGATCPACGATECTRLITGGTFHLKGSGWYASDYAGKSSPPPAAPTVKEGGCGRAECGTGVCAAAAAADAS